MLREKSDSLATGQKDVLRNILGRAAADGCQVEVENEEGKTALWIAAFCDGEYRGTRLKKSGVYRSRILEKDGLDCLNLLLEAQADVEATDRQGVPLLCALALAGRLKQISQLLRYHASLASTDRQGSSVLHYAARSK